MEFQGPLLPRVGGLVLHLHRLAPVARTGPAWTDGGGGRRGWLADPRNDQDRSRPPPACATPHHAKNGRSHQPDPGTPGSTRASSRDACRIHHLVRVTCSSHQDPPACEAVAMTESTHRKLVLLRHASQPGPICRITSGPWRAAAGDAPVMGRWLRAAGHVPDQVVCSTARRARETWELAQPGLVPRRRSIFEDRVYGASAPQLLDLARHAPPAVRTLLVVGHDPGIPGLALLAGVGTPADDDRGSGAVSAGRRRPHEGEVPHRRDRGPRTHRTLEPAWPRDGPADPLRDPPGRGSAGELTAAFRHRPDAAPCPRPGRARRRSGAGPAVPAALP